MSAKDKMIFLLILCLTGVSLGVEVHQSPFDFVTNPGDEVQIFCSHDKTDYFLMLWYQRSPGEIALKLIGYLYYGNPTMEEKYKDNFNIIGDLTGSSKKNASLKIQVVGPEQAAVYYCAASKSQTDPAYFGKGTKLTVLEAGREATPPKSVKILPPSPNECRNQKDKKRKKTLVCVASGFYPDHVKVSWKINEKEVSDGVATDSAAKRIDQFYRITSRLRVPAEIYNTASSKFTCIVSFFDGKTPTPYEKSINGIQGKAEGGMTREKYLKITQGAKLSYIVVIVKSCFFGLFVGIFVWKLQGSARKHH